ncbi:hypothetical protein TCDM_11522 [Trypanosoma cruzi Dm28c]|uniref:Secreted protein n=1 Tax=Trypanosoma cruzi Dm28c TaxID=1416333 RepID=V5B063_TRYCR|nr:hypothetical protein TCDM_11522 [Trypanosoma cruzi Dm28c]
MCILWLCVVVCVCRHTHEAKKIKKGPEHVEDAQNVQRRCVDETTRRRPLKLMTAPQCKQWQFTKDLFKTKKTAFPFVLYKPHHTK